MSKFLENFFVKKDVVVGLVEKVIKNGESEILVDVRDENGYLWQFVLSDYLNRVKENKKIYVQFIDNGKEDYQKYILSWDMGFSFFRKNLFKGCFLALLTYIFFYATFFSISALLYSEQMGSVLYFGLVVLTTLTAMFYTAKSLMKKYHEMNAFCARKELFKECDENGDYVIRKEYDNKKLNVFILVIFTIAVTIALFFHSGMKEPKTPMEKAIEQSQTI